MSYLRIKEILKEKGISSKLLAEKIGVTETGLSRVITEKQQPRFEVLEKIAHQLDVEVWQLFKGSEKAVNGFITYQGNMYRIQTKKDLEELLEKMG